MILKNSIAFEHGSPGRSSTDSSATSHVPGCRPTHAAGELLTVEAQHAEGAVHHPIVEHADGVHPRVCASGIARPPPASTPRRSRPRCTGLTVHGIACPASPSTHHDHIRRPTGNFTGRPSRWTLTCQKRINPSACTGDACTCDTRPWHRSGTTGMSRGCSHLLFQGDRPQRVDN